MRWADSLEKRSLSKSPTMAGNEDFSLEAGYAIYFDSAVQHSYRRVRKRPCEAVTVTMP